MLVIRALATLLACLLLSFSGFCHGPAQAESVPAGFDCDKASGADERIICSDPALRQADLDLAGLYQGLIRSHSDSAYVATLRADEHGWIMLRNKECRVSKATKLTDANAGELVDCFLDAYEERRADLEQMQANPGADPATISAPIRKSLFSAEASQAIAPPASLLDTGLSAESAEHPVLAWQPDGSLLVLGKGSDSGAALYGWREDKPALLLMPRIKRPSRIERLCGRGTLAYLIGRDGVLIEVSVASGATHEMALSDLPADVALACGLDPALRIVGDTSGKTSLILGPAQGPDGKGARLVQWRKAGDSHAVEPAIRIDHRFALTGSYSAIAQTYLVAAGPWPLEMRAAIERRWAKTNCLPYWQVLAKSGEASRQCIPYGDYIGPAPQPLLTAVGVYFAVHGAGLYRSVDSVAQPVLLGPIDGATVSADGCKIAFAGNPVKDGRASVRILEVCRAR
jgi:uncharacterized protein